MTMSKGSREMDINTRHKTMDEWMYKHLAAIRNTSKHVPGVTVGKES